MIQKLVTELDEMLPLPGPAQTHLDGVTLFRSNTGTPRMPLLYDQCLCIAAQGCKTCHLTDRTFSYGPSHFLVVPAIVPIEVETFAHDGKPLLSLTISLDFPMIQEIMDQLGEELGGKGTARADCAASATGAILNASAPSAILPGVYLEPLGHDIIEPVLRLLKSLRSRGEAEVLGRQVVREIFFRVLMGEGGHILASAARGESAYAKISKALRTIHDNYAAPIDVPQLASGANMSVRSFHDHFKAVTSHTPVQYLKRIRLEKARQFLTAQGLQASVTAHMVGYESPSQFSREFKRHFGYPPREAQGHGVAY